MATNRGLPGNRRVPGAAVPPPLRHLAASPGQYLFGIFGRLDLLVNIYYVYTMFKIKRCLSGHLHRSSRSKIMRARAAPLYRQRYVRSTAAAHRYRCMHGNRDRCKNILAREHGRSRQRQ